MKKLGALILILAVIVVGRSVYIAYQAEPEGLIYVVIPAESQEVTELHFDPMINYLSAALDVPVKLMTVADYAGVVEAMRYGHADIARFGPSSYVLATEQAEVEALVRGVVKKTGTDIQFSLIITRADSDITDLNGVTFAFVDVGSNTGYLLPQWHILGEGIELGEIVFAGGHPAVIEMVRNGAVDAGACAANRLDVALEEGLVTMDEIKILWKSPPSPHAPVAVQKSMDPELKELLKEAFLRCPPGIVESLGIGEIGFVPAYDEDYDITREIQDAIDL